MEKFIAYIDETGSFSYLDKSRNCFVGGWVCRWKSGIKSILERFLRKQVQEFCHTTKEQLSYPDDMHFMPLHSPHFRKNPQDRHIHADPAKVPVFFSNVFREILPMTFMVFRSSGMPVIIPHEQAAYMDILRNTLVQLVSDVVCQENFSISIIIARRRQNILYGYRGYDDPDAYEQYLARSLTDEIVRSIPAISKNNIQISFGKASVNPGLIMADFFCGAFKFKKTQYLKEYKEKIRKYRFSTGYMLATDSHEQHLNYLMSIDPVAAFMQGIQIYTATRDEDILSQLREIYTDILGRTQKRLFAAVCKHLDSLLLDRAERYENLDEAENLIKLLLGFLPASASDMDRDELRLQASLNLHSIRIASHRGKIQDGVVLNHINFLNRFSSDIFKNRMEYMQHIIDASLMAVQVQAFNPLKFEEAEENIKPVRDRYEAMFQPEFSGNTIITDENRARLEGTYGQICGFLYNITGEEHYYIQAEESLKNDIDACQSEGRVWEQGMGFLTALYWRNGKLELAIEQFFKETRAEQDRKLLFDLDETKAFGGSAKPFFQLHRLKICALARTKGERISGLDAMKKELMKDGSLNRYPKMLSAKWLAVLHMLDGEYESALLLLKKACCSKDTGNFTIDFIRLPLKMLCHVCLKQSGRQSGFNLEDEKKHLERLRPGAGEILDRLNVGSKASDFAGNVYDMAVWPPFYYA